METKSIHTTSKPASLERVLYFIDEYFKKPLYAEAELGTYANSWVYLDSRCA